MPSRPHENATMASPSKGDTVKPTNTNKSTTNGINVPAFAEGARKRRRLESLTTNSEIPEKTQRRDEPCGTDAVRKTAEHAENRKNLSPACLKRKQDQASPIHLQDATTRRICGVNAGRDDTARLRKTIQWLEEGARKLREDLANVRTELHEERRASKIAKREFETALKEVRFAEAAKYQPIKTKISYSVSPLPSLLPLPLPLPSFKPDPVKDENHRRELSTLRKRLADAESMIRRLEWQSLKTQTNTTRSTNGTLYGEVRRLETEVRSLRTENEKLEEKLRIILNIEKSHTAEIRIQRENHEAELSALRKSYRNETIKMMDELRGKNREIEKLSKLLKRRKLEPVEHDTMRKLRENRPIQSASRIEKRTLTGDDHTVESYVHEVESDRTINEIEVERLRELALEQQEVIELLRQAVKERERKLEQLSKKKKKEEFYKQWLDLEPVAEVDDEEDHEENDSALSSAPSSMSPQPGGCGQWQGNGVTREAYEAVLVEIEELQSKLLKEQRELSRAKVQVCDLEKALSQERCNNHEKELNELNDKLRAAEEREATLLVELSEMREQNELLEFRLLELEETPVRRDSPDHAMDSGIVSPEPTHANKDHLNKQRNRVVATVIPYTNNATVTKSTSPVLPHKPPLTLQESGIFEEEYEDDEESEIELASRGTQTEVPSGELLQEVQRLQELRARIQERAAKTTVFHPVESSKICLDVDSIVQLTSYQERVRELEERLEVYEGAEESREHEKRVSKQREEELLDENYRLTERIYWLENEMRNIARDNMGKANDESENAIIMMRKKTVQTDGIIGGFEDAKDTQDKITTCTRIVQTLETCVNNVIMECSRCQGYQSNVESSDEGTQCNATLVSLEKKKKVDDMESEEPIVVNDTETNPEKKVRRRRIKNNERNVRSAKTARMFDIRLNRDVTFGQRNNPLVLYQEICV